MSSSLPQPFSLPSDPQDLARMRDQLSDYLATLERNTEAVDNWLNTHKKPLILMHHQLTRIVTSGEEKQAIALLENMGDISSFILTMKDFAALGDKVFGDNNSFSRTVRNMPSGVPAHTIEPLPEINLNPDKQEEQKPAAQEPAKEEKGAWWSSVSGWFKKEAGKKDVLEEKRREEEIRARWTSFYKDIISLQSKNHYYIDSFIDWVGETMNPSAIGSNTAELMKSYQNPAYVIQRAQEDYAEVISVKADNLRRDALAYSALASLLDDGDIDGFVQQMPKLFPKKDTDDAKELRAMILQGHEAKSFAAYALENMEDRAKQFTLFKAAIEHEGKGGLTDFYKKEGALDRVLDLTLANDPLDLRALNLALKALYSKEGLPKELYEEVSAKENVFRRVDQRFHDAPEKKKEALTYLLTAGTARIGDISAIDRDITAFMELDSALHKPDNNKLISLLENMINRMDRGGAIVSIYQLCKGSINPMNDLPETDAKTFSKIISLALQTPMASYYSHQNNPFSFNNLRSLLEKHALPALEGFDLGAARMMISAAVTPNSPEYRKMLTQPAGWLHTVIDSALPVEQKREWIAALLEPFPSKITRANILASAAENAATEQQRDILSSLEKNMVGMNIRISDNTLLANIDQIANIWYRPSQKKLCYTMAGTEMEVEADISSEDAHEILSILARRGHFETETMGLFNPAHINKIISAGEVTKAYWNWNNADLSPSLASLQNIDTRKDFLIETDPSKQTIYRTNVNAILILQEQQNGSYVLVDGYGNAERINNPFTLGDRGDLVDIGNNTLINPRLCSLISITEGKVSIRVESDEFDNLLAKTGNNSHFYSVSATADGIDRLRKAIAQAPGIASPGGSLSGLYLNLHVLEYLAPAEGSKSGFHCKRDNAMKKKGMIETSESLTREITDGLKKNADLVYIDGRFIYPEMAHNAYYSRKEEVFYFITSENEVVKGRCAPDDAAKIIDRMLLTPAFRIVGESTHVNKNGFTVTSPSDIMNMDKAVLFKFNSEKGKLYVNESFELGYGVYEIPGLLYRLEQEGLVAAHQTTGHLKWTQDLEKTMQQLSVLPAPHGKKLCPTNAQRLEEIIGRSSAVSDDKENVQEKASNNTKPRHPRP